MTHKIQPLVPVTREGLEEIARSLLEEKFSQDAEKGKGWIKDGWVYVPSRDIRFRTDLTHQNTNWYDTHKSLLKGKTRMPSIEETWELIFYLKANLDNPEHKQLYDSILKTTPENTWHGEWLNAIFSEENGKMYIQKIRGINSSRKLEFTDKVEIIDYLKKDCYADISSRKNISDEGLCRVPSSNNNYSQGNNIRFWFPRKRAVARLGADSDRAYLGCISDLDYMNALLGVRECAEGAQKI